MKRLISILLILTMALYLAACAAKPEPPVEEPETYAEPEPESESEEIEINAAVFWYDFSDTYLSKVRDALDASLTNSGISFLNYDAGSTEAMQYAQIDEAIANGANLLIVNPVNFVASASAQYICDKAKAAHIPIIFFDRGVDYDVIESYDNACYVGIGAADAGRKQGQMAGEYIAANYDAVDLNKDGYISYIMMRGEPDYNVASARSNYAIEFADDVLNAAGRPGLIYFDVGVYKHVPYNWGRDEAFVNMETALSTNPMDSDRPIEVAFANNDEGALGMILALYHRAGWNHGNPDKTIPVFGIDFTDEAAAAIEAGKMTGSVLCPADDLADAIAVLARNVQSGKAVFDGARDMFDTLKDLNIICLPSEIKTIETINN